MRLPHVPLPAPISTADIDTIKHDIAERNALRAEAMMPLLDAGKERARQVELLRGQRERAFESPFRSAVRGKMLVRGRRVHGPDWTPGPPLNGGMLFGVMVDRRVARVVARLKHRAAR
jgi:hypothetical protein